jgi:hypothetical protein
VPPEISPEARRWLEQAVEDVTAARRGIAIRKIHDLVELQSSLIYADAEFVSSQDVDVLVPWNIAGRYPADVGDADRETALSTVAAASRIVDGLARRILDAD